MAPTRSGVDFRYSAGIQEPEGSASVELPVVTPGTPRAATVSEDSQGEQTGFDTSELTPLGSQDAASIALPPSEVAVSESEHSGTSRAASESIPTQGVADVLPVHHRALYSKVVADRSTVDSGLDAGPVELSKNSRRETVDREGSDEEGFITPRSVVRSMSRPSRATSPSAQSSKFFPDWFEGSGNDVSKPSLEVEQSQSWADLPDDGPGELPKDWTRSIKVENTTPENVTPMSEVIRKVMEAADEKTRDLLDKRLRHVLQTPGIELDSESSDSEFKKSVKGQKRGRQSRRSSRRSSRILRSKSGLADTKLEATAHETWPRAPSLQRIPYLDKGKDVDPSERTGIPPASIVTDNSEDDSDSDEMLQRDWELANALQQKLDEEEAVRLSLRDDYLLREQQKVAEVLAIQKEYNAVQQKIRKKARQRAAKKALPRVKMESTSSMPAPHKEKYQSASTQPSKVQVHESVDQRARGRFDKASSQLPRSSRLRYAMEGHDEGGPSDPSGNETDETVNSRENNTGKRYRNLWTSDESDASDMFPNAPDSVHSSDSEPTKSRKRRLKRKYNDKMLRLKYQQGFLKVDPPFVYNGEVRADLYKKWVQEVRLFIKLGGLKVKQSLLIMGKYLGGRAYHWYDREIRGTRKHYTLAQFFTGLFDHVFPPDFRAQQRDLFDACEQRKRTVRDYLQNLRDLANTVGNIRDQDIVLGFWRRSESYLRIELTKAGYDAESLTLSKLEELAVQYERVHILSEKEERREKSGLGTNTATHGSNSHSGNNRERNRSGWKPRTDYHGQDKPKVLSEKANPVPSTVAAKPAQKQRNEASKPDRDVMRTAVLGVDGLDS